MNRSDFPQLSQIRIEEAKALLDAGLCGGAHYLAGCAVECVLQADRCSTEIGRIPDIKPRCVSHSLSRVWGIRIQNPHGLQEGR